MKQRIILLLMANVLSLLTGGLFENANSQNALPGDLPLQDSVSIDGITWTFSQAVPVGRFVNGDYYVVGPVTIVNIDPLPTPGNGRDGSVLNMPVDNSELSPFDSRVAASRYAPQLRVYPPFTMHPGDALISSIRRPGSSRRRAPASTAWPPRPSAPGWASPAACTWGKWTCAGRGRTCSGWSATAQRSCPSPPARQR